VARIKPNTRDVAGILLLDKPAGMTSNQALQRVKRLFNAAKAGHTGSLDPLATGMLPICFGAATKTAQFGLAANKSYRVQARLGVQTDTDDADGRVLVEQGGIDFDEADVRAALEAHTGEQSQIPPMYSALKHEGRRLYALAREGIEVERQPRRVQISALVLERYEPPLLGFRVDCSKGTYVRTLVVDIARALGTVGHVTVLRRLSVEPFGPSRLWTLEELERLSEAGGLAALDEALLPADAAIEHLCRVDVGENAAADLRHGRSLVLPAPPQTGQVRVYASGEDFVGIAEIDAAGRLQPRRIFLR
jgi:tRNA pseudouridine55 synthase